MVQSIGREASERVVYAAMTEHLNHDAGFEDFRAACLQAARDRYGADSPEYRGVDEAFREVGLTAPGGAEMSRSPTRYAMLRTAMILAIALLVASGCGAEDDGPTSRHRPG